MGVEQCSCSGRVVNGFWPDVSVKAFWIGSSSSSKEGYVSTSPRPSNPSTNWRLWLDPGGSVIYIRSLRLVKSSEWPVCSWYILLGGEEGRVMDRNWWYGWWERVPFLSAMFRHLSSNRDNQNLSFSRSSCGNAGCTKASDISCRHWYK